MSLVRMAGRMAFWKREPGGGPGGTVNDHTVETAGLDVGALGDRVRVTGDPQVAGGGVALAAQGTVKVCAFEFAHIDVVAERETSGTLGSGGGGDVRDNLTLTVGKNKGRKAKVFEVNGPCQTNNNRRGAMLRLGDVLGEPAGGEGMGEAQVGEVGVDVSQGGIGDE